jgi:hypothetical protein
METERRGQKGKKALRKSSLLVDEHPSETHAASYTHRGHKDLLTRPLRLGEGGRDLPRTRRSEGVT